MKILIIGKLTNLAEEEKNSYFHNAMQLLYKYSWNPVNPSELLKDHSRQLGKLIEKIESLMLKCEAVIMLENWRDCAGATILHSIAKHNKIPVYYQEWHTPLLMTKFRNQIKEHTKIMEAERSINFSDKENQTL
jgi:hypothetical protein